MDCRHATQLISEAEDRSLGITERVGLEVHLTICRGCDNYREQLRLLQQACRVYREQLAGDTSPTIRPPSDAPGK